VISYHNMCLAFSFDLIVVDNMEIQKSVPAYSINRLLLTVLVTCAVASTAFSAVAGPVKTHSRVYLQSSSVRKHQTSDYITIGSRTYNPESRSFERPWPFGPESSQQ
jgi:hypothetical protein